MYAKVGSSSKPKSDDDDVSTQRFRDAVPSERLMN